MFCNKCGSKVEDGALFCGSCGANVGATPNFSPIVTKTEDVKAKKKFPLIPILASMMGILVVIILCVGGFLLFGEKKYEVQINVYSAVDVSSDSDGLLDEDLLEDMEVIIRKGEEEYEGKTLVSKQGDEKGELMVKLPSGTYTAEIDVPGYAVSYIEFEVEETPLEVFAYVLPEIQDESLGVVMTWDGDVDLDLILFTPYKSALSDESHIGANITEDENGNKLIADNVKGCEVLYINTMDNGDFRLCVNNYTDSSAENYLSDELVEQNVRIYMYDKDGFVAKYTFPNGKEGVVWDVLEIHDKEIVSIDEVYTWIEDGNWWMSDKIEKKLVQEIYYSYDMAGSVTSHVDYFYVYDSEGKLITKTKSDNITSERNTKEEYTYDNNGNLICKTESNDKGNINYKEGYAYDNQGNLVNKTKSYNNEFGNVWTEEYIYDDRGLLITKYESHYLNDTQNKTEYVYDEQGKLIVEMKYYPYGGYLKYEYTYDEKGNLIRKYESEEEELPWFDENYVYDDQGKLEKYEWFSSGGTRGYSIYAYDERGYMLTKIDYSQYGEVHSRTEYIYDYQ